MMLNRQLDFIPLCNKRFIWLNVLVWILLIWYWRTSGFAIWNGLLSVRYYRNKKEIKVEFNSLVRQIKYPEVTTYPIDEEVDTATFYHLFMYFELDQCCYFTCYFVLSACMHKHIINLLNLQWDQCTQDNSEASHKSSIKEFYTF